jgi:DNA-binding NarL/FixJ family response regulator
MSAPFAVLRPAVLKNVPPSVTRRLFDAMADRLPDAGALPGAGTDGRLGKLTERELEVLMKVANGLSNAEFAGRGGLPDRAGSAIVSGV